MLISRRAYLSIEDLLHARIEINFATNTKLTITHSVLVLAFNNRADKTTFHYKIVYF